MRMRFVPVLLLSAALLVTPACAGKYGDIQKSLNENEQRWDSQNVTDYRYTLQISCFCPEEITRPVVIEVRNSIAVSIIDDEGMPADAEVFKSFNTKVSIQ